MGDIIPMLLATANKSKQLLYLQYIQHVTVEELKKCRQEIEELLLDLGGGFRVIADLAHLDTMEANCAGEIGKIMELCEHKGMEMVVRIIPDPAKDIGFNILSVFHYHRRHRTVTCENLLEAAEILSL